MTGARSVLFSASTPLSYAVVAPLWRQLAADPRIDVRVTARHGGRQTARQCLGSDVRYAPNVFTLVQAFDLVVSPGFHFRPIRPARTVQIFHGVSPKNYAASADTRRYDFLFLTGEYHRRKMERAGLIAPDDPRVLRVGMPKTDPLLAAEPERGELVRALELDPDKPTVLYAPTRSGSAGSSVDSWGIEAIDRLAALPVNVVVKLHDRSLKRFRRKLEVDFEELLANREAQGKLRLFRHHDVIPALRAADVLVTDLSSVANEFLLRDRPVIYLAVPGHEEHIRRTAGKKFGADDPEHLDWLRAAGDLVEEPAALPAAVERALADPARLSAERRERSRILFYNPGTATSHAVEGLYRILDLAPV